MQKIQPVAAMTEQRKKNLNDLQGLYFPSTIGHHAMILNFKQYAYGGSAHMSGITSKSIILPLPKNLQDNLSVKVGSYFSKLVITIHEINCFSYIKT